MAVLKLSARAAHAILIDLIMESPVKVDARNEALSPVRAYEQEKKPGHWVRLAAAGDLDLTQINDQSGLFSKRTAIRAEITLRPTSAIDQRSEPLVLSG